VHHLGQAFGDRQAQTRAAEFARALSAHLREGAEDRFLLVRRDADAGVFDFQEEVHAGFVWFLLGEGARLGRTGRRPADRIERRASFKRR